MRDAEPFRRERFHEMFFLLPGKKRFATSFSSVVIVPGEKSGRRAQKLVNSFSLQLDTEALVMEKSRSRKNLFNENILPSAICGGENNFHCSIECKFIARHFFTAVRVEHLRRNFRKKSFWKGKNFVAVKLMLIVSFVGGGENS